MDGKFFPVNRKDDSIFILKVSLTLNLHKASWPWEVTTGDSQGPQS